VTLSPTSANFFSVALGSSSSAKTFTLKNGQSGALTISSVSASGDYQIQTSNCPMSPTSLASGMSCTVIVVFTPTAVGVRSGTLAVADDATSSPQTASLTGTGIAAVTITPSTLSFGNVPVGSTSASKTATVKNQQKIALTISSVTISGDYQIQANNCTISPATLAVNDLHGLSSIPTYDFWYTGRNPDCQRQCEHEPTI